MWPCKQKDCQYESDAGGGKNPGLEPAALGGGCFVKPGADARQKRGGDLRRRGAEEDGVEGREVGMLRVQLVGRGGGRRRGLGLGRQRAAQFAAFPGAQTVEREAKRDSNEPSAEAVAVAQAFEPAIGAQQGFLGYIFGVGSVAQDATSHAIGERAALGEALLELAPRISLGRFVLQLIPDRAPWLDQNQLLHLLSCASFERPPSPHT